MKERITKIEVNNEIKEIKKLISENKVDIAESKCFDLAKRIVLSEGDVNSYFDSECISIINKIIINECSRDCTGEIDVDYIIGHFDILSKEVMKVQERLIGTLSIDIIKALKELK